MKCDRRIRFAEVWAQHQPRIWRLVARLAADPDVADDLTQEVSLRAFQGFESFRGQASVLTWLSRIAINVVYRHRERARRDAVMRDTSDLALLSGEDTRDPGERVVDAERRLAIGAALQSLPEELRTTLILQVWEGLKYREIAEILQVPISTVRWRRHEAIRRLREELKGDAL